jgi:phospholipase/carboxylesterase
MRALRRVVLLLLSGAGCLLLAACAGGQGGGTTGSPAQTGSDLRLDARPGQSKAARCIPGVHELAVGQGRKALLHVARPGSERKRSFLLALHGAGSGGARGGLWIFRAAWDQPGLVIAAPSAAGTSWALSDVPFVDRVLRRSFARCPVDPKRVTVGGFSAGASLSLYLGLANGDLFRSVISLSPGGGLPADRIGKPRVFLAHGTKDLVIPIELGGDLVASRLRQQGYEVVYRRFAGGHRVMPELAARFVRAASR